MKRVLLLTTTVITMGLACSTASSSPLRSESYYAQAHRIIWNVFPPSTRQAAFNVAYCETGGFTDFYNNSSGAKGLFQEIPGNNGRVFRWNGKSVRLNFGLLSSQGPTYHAAIVALYQSRGGWSWSEWDCKP